MPKFDRLPMDPTVGAFANPKQAQIAREYMGYIDKLEPGQMGRLTPAEGETLLAVRKRLGVAAKLSGKRLEIRQMKGDVYFWFRRPGPRRRKTRNAAPESSEEA